MTGKIWKSKEEENIMLDDDESVSTKLEDVLAQATDEELVDLAGKKMCTLVNSVLRVTVHSRS